MDPSDAAPGWYADPLGRYRSRWWDGARWTAYAANATEAQWDEAFALPQPDGIDEPSPPLPGLATAVAGYATGVVASAIVWAVLAAADYPAGGRITALVLSQAALWSGLIGACLVVSRRRGTGRLLHDFGWRFRWRDIGLGVAGSIAARMVSIAVVSPFAFLLDGDEPNTEVFDEVLRGRWDWLIAAALVCVGAPLVEELFFRGLMQPRIVERFGAQIGLPVTAVLFGAAHATNWQGPITLFYVGAVAGGGLVLGLIARETGRLGTATWTHAWFNAQAVALGGL